MNAIAREFISCDWGTTALRLRLVTGDGDSTTAPDVASADGIGAVHRAWKESGGGSATRETFYRAVLRTQLRRLSAAAHRSLSGLPLVLSGMASATIGFRELPYKQLPLALDGSDLAFETIAASETFQHSLLLISGARVADDVMRGEEIQVVGAAELEPGVASDGLVILPGTHSKHVRISGACATALKTYMTGEFFELLSRHSILAASVDVADDAAALDADVAFAEGVRTGAAKNLLHASFSVRVANISGTRSRAENGHFLSGLLIGAELADVAVAAERSISVVGSDLLTKRYARALQILGWTGRPRIVDAAMAVIAGQRRVARRAGLLA